MKYTTEFIRKLNEKIDIVKLANQYTKVQKVGNLWQASCPHPDHNDKLRVLKFGINMVLKLGLASVVMSASRTQKKGYSVLMLLLSSGG